MKMSQRPMNKVAVALAGFAILWNTGCAAEPAGGKKPVPAQKAKPGTALTPAVKQLDPALVLVDVNGQKLTVKEADAQIKTLLGPQAEQMGEETVEQMQPRFRREVVERFVMRTILTAESDRKGVKVESSDMDAAITVIKSRLPPGMTLEEALSKQGLTEQDMRKDLTEEVRFKKLIDSEVSTNVAPSDDEVALFYNENKKKFTTPESAEARHILLKVADDDTAEIKAQKKAKAADLRKQLVDGADFDKLARENSDCPSKTRGGNLGTFGRGQMVKPFEDAVFSQSLKEIGPVVETIFGYHVIQVLDRTPAKTNSLAEVKERLSEALKQRSQMEAVNRYLLALRSRSKITYDDSVRPSPKESGAAAQ